jgi:1-aminocyclopropane-1-carboxylate deaminase
MFDQIAQTVPYQNLNINSSVHLTVKRLDQIHPHVSGNKFFKLKYNFLEAQHLGYKKILTFGGAYSNHIAAVAYAAQLFGFESIGIIRGEELANKPLNHTLTVAQQMGMHLKFVSRENYKLKQDPEFQTQLKAHFQDCYIIPEGGSNTLAIQGCQEILNNQDLTQYDVISCAVGTGGTIAGLIESSNPLQHVLGFSALKGDFLKQEIQQWTARSNWSLTDAYCCGGYAKTTSELLKFIQNFEQQYQLPLEHIYTGKMFYGIFDLISKHYFAENTRILLIHTGGLQGRLL